jgi:amino acid permease
MKSAERTACSALLFVCLFALLFLGSETKTSFLSIVVLVKICIFVK